MLGRVGSFDTALESLTYPGANFDAQTGRYVGGNSFLDWFCGTVFGQAVNPTMCAIPSTAQVRQQQVAELATTSMTPAGQVAAVTAGDVAVAQDCAATGDCAAQDAAANNPILSAVVGPQTVAAATNPPAWLWAVLAGAGLLFLMKE